MWISLPCTSTCKRNVAVLWFCQLVLILYTPLRQQLFWVTVYRELDAPSLYVLLIVYTLFVCKLYNIVSGPVRFAFASRRVLNRLKIHVAWNSIRTLSEVWNSILWGTSSQKYMWMICKPKFSFHRFWCFPQFYQFLTLQIPCGLITTPYTFPICYAIRPWFN